MSKRIVAPALLAVILAVLLLQLPFAIAARSAEYNWCNPILDVWGLINHSYVEEVDNNTLRDSAINGMVESLGDPFTEYIPAVHVAEFDKNMRGTFVGIGASVRMEDGWPVIVTPMDDSPAYEAGVLAGDRIIRIDGETTQGLTIQQVVDRLTGKPGSEVVVRVARNDGTEKDITIVRRRIFTRTIKGYYRENGDWKYTLDPERGVLYVRITQFTQTTAPRLLTVLQQNLSNTKGIVLDLRANPGGLLQSAVQIADMFLPDDLVIVSSEGRKRARQEFISSDKNTVISPDVPLIVLVDGSSASASEILAGALSDHKRAIIVGTRTYGKGTVQSVVPLKSGAGELKITEAYYHLPSGRVVHRTDKSTRWGVDPSEGYFVPVSQQDLQELQRWEYELDIIHNNDEETNADSESPIAAHTEEWSDPDWIRKTRHDPQLAAAVEAIYAKLDTGEWKKTGEKMTAADLDLHALLQLETSRQRLLRELGRLDRRITTLREGAAGAEPQKAERDLWPDDLNIKGGEVIVLDPEGRQVARLRIVGNDLERWLIDADVKPEETTTPQENTGEKQGGNDADQGD